MFSIMHAQTIGTVTIGMGDGGEGLMLEARNILIVIALFKKLVARGAGKGEGKAPIFCVFHEHLLNRNCGT